jgi:predicted phage tail protein
LSRHFCRDAYSPPRSRDERLHPVRFLDVREQPLANADTATVEAGATRAGMGTTWTSHNLKNGHTYYWYIRTINAFGASAFVEVAALCQTDTGELIDIIDDSVRDSDALKMSRKVWTPTLKLPCRMPWLITVRLNISTSS